MRAIRSVTVGCLLACSGCKSAGSVSPPAPTGTDCVLQEGYGPAGTVPISVEVMASGLEIPWGLAFLGNDEVLITERPGRVRLLQGKTLVPEPVATLSIRAASEGGLLGIVLHPQFATNRQFYLYMTDQPTGSSDHVNRVERWVLSEDHKSATRDRVIFDGIPGSTNHDGGRLRIGPDGMLYVGTGDATTPSNSQSLDTPSGKLLRLTLEGEVPSDNPFPGKPTFLLGIRNTQGFDWRDDSTLYVTDHGPSGEYQGRRGHDEINVAKAGDNLGWPDIYSCETADGKVTPSLTFETAAPPGGAAIYRGSAIPEWKGSLLIGTLGSKHLHRVVFDAEHPNRIASHEVYLDGTYGRLRDVIMGPDGNLWVTTSNCDGRGDCGPDRDIVFRVTR